MHLILSKGLFSVSERHIDRGEPSEDERYTVPYIEREATLVLRYLCKEKKFCLRLMSTQTISELDKRIMYRWGIK